MSTRSEDLSTAMRRLDRITDRAGAVLHALAGDARLDPNGRPSSRSMEAGLDVQSLPAFLAIIGLVKADVVEEWRAAGVDVAE